MYKFGSIGLNFVLHVYTVILIKFIITVRVCTVGFVVYRCRC